MAGSVLIRTACFVIFSVCGALCQLPQENTASLPDAPTVQASTQADFNSTTRFGNFALLQEKPDQNSSRDFFTRHLYPTLPKRNLNFQAANEGLVRRATYAAFRTLVTGDDYGRARPDISLLLRTLTSVARDSASTPYWRRHLADPFSDFGTTIGDDVGMNVLHEFEPGIGRLLKNRAPKLVMAMETHRGRAHQR